MIRRMITVMAAGILLIAHGGAQTNADQGDDTILSCQIVTGDYSVKYQRGAGYIGIQRKAAPRGPSSLALLPGGGDPTFNLLDPASVRKVLCNSDSAGSSIVIEGELDWCTYRVTLAAPRSLPGLINSRSEIVLSRDVDPREELFQGTYPELAYRGAEGQEQPGSTVAPVYYFNGTPEAKTYHTVAPDSGTVYDLNQFIYFGDTAVLQSTLHYYVDFTSLNRFFNDSGTRILATVIQPPGCLEYPPKAGLDGAMAFGYDIPGLELPIKRGTSLRVTNSFLYLAPIAPGIREPVKYCTRFIEGYDAIYPGIEKPATKFNDWPAITEQGFKDVFACQEVLGRNVMGPQTNLWSCRRYLDRFASSIGWELVRNDEELWSEFHLSLPYGDAWQYLFPLIIAGEYANDFNSEAARGVFRNAGDDVVKLGRALNYIFPLRINDDLSGAEGFLNEYDCTGAYVYLMLLYHDFTGEGRYLEEARRAADVLIRIGFEFPYEFTTTSVVPVALLRLHKRTGDPRYLEACAIPLAAILRHSWLFNPDYDDYRGRTIFLLTEGMPGVYSNGWEEAALIRYLRIFLDEGEGIVDRSILDLVSEILRWKGVSLADSLVPLLPDDSIVYAGLPREWPLPVKKEWYIPVEGFGYLEWDNSGLHDKLGRVSQGPYCFGALPEAAMLLFHPLNDHGMLYVEAPVRFLQTDSSTFVFNVLGGQAEYRAALRDYKGNLRLVAQKESLFEEFDSDGWRWMRLRPDREYGIVLAEIETRDENSVR